MPATPFERCGRALIAALSGLGLLGGPPAAAALYKCTGADGKLRFQDRPCAAGERSTEIESAAPSARGAAAEDDVELQVPERGAAQRGENFRIDTREVQSAAWLEAIAQASRQPSLRSRGGSMTLLRVLLEGDRSATVQLQAAKLKGLGESSGGGSHREASHGDFVLIEHIHASTRERGKDRLTLASLSHGRAEIRVAVPDADGLWVLGDVTLLEAPTAQKGTLEATIEANGVAGAPQGIAMRLGPIAVGGRYGARIAFDSLGRTRPISLAPGSYEIAMPDFDAVTSRFRVELGPGERLRVHFRATSPRVVEIFEIDREPSPASSGR